MTRNEIIALQRRVGTTPDGWWGPKSIAACQRHLRRLMPDPSPWPGTRAGELVRFFGEPGDEARLVAVDVRGLGVMYEETPVRSVRCHELLAESLAQVLRRLRAGPLAWVLWHYAGCFNARKMRGGTSWSLHAWGAAIDLWPERNGNRTSWPVAAAMPVEVMEEFAREGWVAAGAFWGRDAMHFQATR